MNVGDKFILHLENGRNYTIEIVNVNEFREPSLRYAADVWDDEGNHPEDVKFFGDEFFEKNKNKIEKIGGVYHTGAKDGSERGITNEEAIKIIKQFRDRQGNSSDDNEAFDIAIKAIETQDRLTKMLNKRITSYAEVEKSKHLNDLEYGRKTAYAHCLEVLNDDE